MLDFERCSPRIDKKISIGSNIGIVNGLAVLGNSSGYIIDIEVSAVFVGGKDGKVKISGLLSKKKSAQNFKGLRKQAQQNLQLKTL